MVVVVIVLAIAGGCTSTPPAPSGDLASVPVSAPVSSRLPSPVPVLSTPVPTTVPSATPTTLPVVGAAPAGPWTQVDWVATHGTLPLGPDNLSVVGWSGGYVAFRVSGLYDASGNEAAAGVEASASTDGLRWSQPATLDVSGLDRGVEFAGMVEGPGGLLAISNEPAGTCGGPSGANALWRSSNGRTWKRVPFPKVFQDDRVVTIDGGSAGYLATGILTDGNYGGIWASQDGVAWRTLAPPAAATGTVVVNDGTSFAGGFVLGGAILGPEGCGGPTSIHPSVWWSADGRSWTRETIDGALTSNDAQLSVERISDEVVVVIETSSKPPTLRAWISTDGRSWSRVASPASPVSWPIRSDGRRGVIVLDPQTGTGPPIVIAIDEHLRLTELVQHGPGPVAAEDKVGWTATIGPTGILVVRYDGSDVWLGVPH